MRCSVAARACASICAFSRSCARRWRSAAMLAAVCIPDKYSAPRSTGIIKVLFHFRPGDRPSKYLALQPPLARSFCRTFELADAREIFQPPRENLYSIMQQNLPGHFALPISTELDQYLGSLEKYEKDVIIWLACQCLEMAVDKFRKKHAQ